MISQLTYNLTHYTDFRKLEFEYSKLQDENADLNSRLLAIENMYRSVVDQFERSKQQCKNKQIDIKVQKNKVQQFLDEIIKYIDNMNCEINKLERMGIYFGDNVDQSKSIDKLDYCKRVMNKIFTCLMTTLNKHNDLALKYEKQISFYKNQIRQNKKRDNDLCEEISYITQQISKLQTTNTSLMNQINILKRQNVDYKIQIYEMNKQNLEQSSVSTHRQDHIEDNNFALDLLNYEKQLLERIFTRILTSIKNQSLNQGLAEIYSSYQSVSEAYREKLQIQYDLQDFQREYKRQKNSKVSQNLLIELRKQIQNFRAQLHKQKEFLSKEDQCLQQNFINLQAADRDEKQLRNYTIEIEKKLKDIKSYNDTKRNSNTSVEQKSSRIQFKATTKIQDVMKEMVRKDRQNIQKIFKQTRLNYIKSSNT